jgi:hypothetical protein
MTAQITSTVDRERDFTTVTVKGDVTASDVRNQIVSFLTAKPTQRVLWDIRQGSLAKLSSDGMREILDAGAPHAESRRGGRTAILCAHPLDYGLSRMFEILATLYHLPFDIQVFRDEREAMHWVFESSDTTPST